MPELTASTREAARRLGVSDTAIHKAERAGRIAREQELLALVDKGSNADALQAHLAPALREARSASPVVLVRSGAGSCIR